MFTQRCKQTKSGQQETKFRHELKYQIDNLQMEILKNRLPAILLQDPHVDASGVYQIRSLYFDDYDNSCYYDVENGTDPREKFRIRIYNHSDAVIHLELKRKERGKTHKRSCSLTREQADRLIKGQNLIWQEDMDPLMKKFYIWFETRAAQPKVIVEYDRIPFVYPDGNVRITLDLSIRGSLDVRKFFDADLPCRPIMPTGSQLLEVKFDEFLPDFIYRSIQGDHLSVTSFSKYYLCRKFGGFL